MWEHVEISSKQWPTCICICLCVYVYVYIYIYHTLTKFTSKMELLKCDNIK